LALGPLSARIEALLGHPRFATLSFDGTAEVIWAGLASHGRPIQYAHVPTPLALWDVWTPIAGPPVAFEPPSAGFVLDWRSLAQMCARGVRFATLTHAAGISSTGDPELDYLLPLDEAYLIPAKTATAVNAARAHGDRVIAIGTTVVRALEAAGARDGLVQAGNGVAIGRIGVGTKLQIVDAIITGTHEPGTSHHALLGAFLDEARLRRIDAELAAHRYRTHEFGDSLLIEREAITSRLGSSGQRSGRRAGYIEREADAATHGTTIAELGCCPKPWTGRRRGCDVPKERTRNMHSCQAIPAT
jgi:S-adenosylmethionine:tRNA ribosyltransferase-isomerase